MAHFSPDYQVISKKKKGLRGFISIGPLVDPLKSMGRGVIVPPAPFLIDPVYA